MVAPRRPRLVVVLVRGDLHAVVDERHLAPLASAPTALPVSSVTTFCFFALFFRTPHYVEKKSYSTKRKNDIL